MEIDFIIAISVFIFIIALVSIYVSNYLSVLQVDVLEYREKASEILERIFSSASEEDFYVNPKAVEKIKRIPITIRNAEEYRFLNEPIAIKIDFDKKCKNLTWNSTIRVYDENLYEIPIRLSYQRFCEGQYVNSTLITMLTNISENSLKRVFVYFSDNREIVPKNYGDFNLIAYYQFDENYGIIAKDSSGNEVDAFLKNGTESCFNYDCPTWIEGRFNYALNFDGVNDYLDCSNINGYLKTIEFWIKPNSSNEPIIQLNSNVNIKLENSYIKANGIGQSVIYVNGIENGSVNINEWNYVIVITNSSVEVKDCSIARIENEFYNGAIDEIRFWSITKNLDYVIARNSSNIIVKVYPEEEIEVISSRRLNLIRNLSYDYIRSLLELNYRLRMEIASQ